jgi:hypothetical protein
MKKTRWPKTANYPSPKNLPSWTEWQNISRPGEIAKHFQNARFSVVLRDRTVSILMGITNFDQSARHDWRDFQRIKNELLGPEWECYEIYPSERRLVDPSNMYILWCFPPAGIRIMDVGMNDRRVWSPAESCAPQRAFTMAAATRGSG